MRKQESHKIKINQLPNMILPERNNSQALRGLLSVARFRGLLQSRGAQSKKSGRKVAYQKLRAIAEESREDTVTSDSSSELTSTPTEFDDVVRLLSSRDMDQNRVGVQRLMVLTATTPHCPASSFQTARAIVYGGGEPEEELRNLVCSFISDEVERPGDKGYLLDWENEDGESDDASFSSLEDDDDPALRGKDWGGLHAKVLHVIANALEQILTSDDATDAVSLDFTDPFWRKVVDTLCHNVEWCHSTDVTGYSLKILRLLHTFEPVQVSQLLQHILLPYLAHLEENGRSQSPLVEAEASKLMRRANVIPSSLIEI